MSKLITAGKGNSSDENHLKVNNQNKLHKHLIMYKHVFHCFQVTLFKSLSNKIFFMSHAVFRCCTLCVRVQGNVHVTSCKDHLHFLIDWPYGCQV